MNEIKNQIEIIEKKIRKIKKAIRKVKKWEFKNTMIMLDALNSQYAKQEFKKYILLKTL